VTDVDRLWLAALQEVVGQAAHEVKNALNGVHLNLEALRSRSGRDGANVRDLSTFADSAADQLESLSARSESLLFLTRSHRAASGPADVAVTLRHLATLLIDAAKTDGGTFEVAGFQGAAPTAAPAPAVRLALASGLLGLINERGARRCALEPRTREGHAETVVRFSHESASPCRLDPAVAGAIAAHQIRTESSGSELHIVFPGS
jgi:signal transduction histidine kinase